MAHNHMDQSPALFISDCTAPFFSQQCTNNEINWSKIPFSEIESEGNLTSERISNIVENFKIYLDKVIQFGFNAISIDDLCHCVNSSLYPRSLQNKLLQYEVLYQKIFTIAANKSVKIFVNTDLMFFNESICRYTKCKDSRIIRFLSRTILKLFKLYPQVSGIILRSGECDGIDVKGDFNSKLIIKRTNQFRKYIKQILSICEDSQKYLIVRTWSLGAFPIGDLMWNKKTFNAVFSGFDSEYLITSHKFGETDFFRYQNMTANLFECNHKKIIEFQARREYEGFGEFPSFSGFDNERYCRYLFNCPGFFGISVWCQTGGWTHFKRITFLENSSIWNELNAFVTVRIFKGNSAENAIGEFTQRYLHKSNKSDMILFLRYADKVVKELWYIPEFAQKRLYFRRTRVPPSLHIFWDNIVINHTVRKILRRFVHERREAITDGKRALQKISKMKELAIQLGLPTQDIVHQYELFEILVVSREYFFGSWKPKKAAMIQDMVEHYNQKYPEGFHFHLDFSPVRFKKWIIKVLFKVGLRNCPHYRFLDRILIIHFSRLIYPIVTMFQKNRLPSFTKDQAMGIHIFFK